MAEMGFGGSSTSSVALGSAAGNPLASDAGGASSDLLAGTDWGKVLGAAGDVFSGLGSAFGSYLTMQGAKAQAKLYGQAATLAGQDVGFQQESTAVQEMQQQREALKSIGSTQTAIAGAGFSSSSGSASDLLAMSAQQSSLAHTLIGVQGQIKETGYREQQLAYLAQQQGAETAATSAEGGILGGVLQAGLGIAKLFF